MIDSDEAFAAANNSTVSFPYSMSVPYLVLPSIIPGNSNAIDIPNNSRSVSSKKEHDSLIAFVRRNPSPDQGMYTTSHQSFSSSSHDSHSIDYHDKHPIKKRESRPRISDTDSTGLVDHQMHHSRPHSRTSFPRSRSSTSSSLSQPLDGSFNLGRSSSSSSSFSSPPLLAVELDRSIVVGSETDGLYPSTSGDSGSDIVSSSLSTIDSHNTSIGSVDISYMMSTAIANTPSETYYTTLHDASFSSFNGIDAIPTPQPQKLSQSSRNANSTPNSMLTRTMSKLSRSHRPPPTIDTNMSFMNTPFTFPSPSSAYDPTMNHLMSPLGFGSPDGDGQLPLISPSTNSSGNYQWDPRSTPLQNLASVSETLLESNSSGDKSLGSAGIAGGNQRVTRSRSSPQVNSDKPPKGPQRKSPRASPRLLPTEKMPSPDGEVISPVKLNSPKFLPSPEEESQATKRLRTDEHSHSRVEIAHSIDPFIAPEDTREDNDNVSNLSSVSVTSSDENLSRQHRHGRRNQADKSSSTTKKANMNRRKRRRNDLGEEDDNILRVAIADSSELRSISPINIPIVEEVN